MVAEPSGGWGHPTYGDVAWGNELVAISDTTLLMTASSGASFVFRTTGEDRTWTTPLLAEDGGAGFVDLTFSDATYGAVIHSPAFRAGISGNNPPAVGTLCLTSNGGAYGAP